MIIFTVCLLFLTIFIFLPFLFFLIDPVRFRVIAAARNIKRSFPAKDFDFYKMALTFDTLRIILGKEWTNQSAFVKFHQTKDRHFSKTTAYLQSEELGFQYQQRLYKIANDSFLLRKISGVKKVWGLMKKGDIYAGSSELEIGSFLARRKIRFKFLETSGTKGEDFDLEIKSNGVKINGEVKHKIEETNLSKEVLERTLSAANKQVPKNEPAIYFIKIPESWIKNQNIVDVVERTKGTFFPRNNNVLGVVFYWEERLAEGLFLYKFRFENNIHSAFPNCEPLTKALSGPGLLKQETLEDLVKKYILK